MKGYQREDSSDMLRAEGSKMRGPSKGIPAVKTEWKDSSEGIRAKGYGYWSMEGSELNDPSGGI